MRKLVPILIASLVLACTGSEAECIPPGTTYPLSIDTGDSLLRFSVEVADEADERETGLMGRASLPDGRGMAFVYDEPVRSGFWMKDTTIPLSIAFWGADGRIVEIRNMEPCASEDCPLTTPNQDFMGAVEVPRGALAGVAIGDHVRLEAPPCP